MPHGDHHALVDRSEEPQADDRRQRRRRHGVAERRRHRGRRSTTSPLRRSSASPSTTRSPYRSIRRAERQHAHRRPEPRPTTGHRRQRTTRALPGAKADKPPSNLTAASCMPPTAPAIERIRSTTGQSATISVWPDNEFTFVPKDVKYRFYLHSAARCCHRTIPKVLYTAGNRRLPNQRRR